MSWEAEIDELRRREALARQAIGRHREVVGDAPQEAEIVVVVVAEAGGAGEDLSFIQI